MTPIFYLVGALTLGGAVAAMSLRNPVHCALSLVVTFVGLAGLYLGLGAQFLGLAQVLVYVGAVAILLVFVMLLTRSVYSDDRPRRLRKWGMSLLLACAVAGVLIAAAADTPTLPARAAPPEIPAVRQIGVALMTEFVVPLQVVGVLLTAAMIGAAVIAARERPARPEGRKASGE